MSATFGEIRSLLQQRATPGLWSKLHALLERTDAEQRESLTAYAQDHTRTWPVRWCLLESDHKIAALARHIILDSHHEALAEVWLQDPDLVNVESLTLGDLKWSAQHLEWLQQGPYLRNLRQVALVGTRFRSPAHALLDALPPSLQELRLWDVRLPSEALDAATALLTRANITTLGLHGLPDPTPLLRACDTDTLTTLHITGTQDPLNAIASRGSWPKLSTLDLRDTDLTDRDLRAFASKTDTPNLQTLYLGDVHVSVATLRAWPQLTSVCITDPSQDVLDVLKERDITLL